MWRYLDSLLLGAEVGELAGVQAALVSTSAIDPGEQGISVLFYEELEGGSGHKPGG